MENTPSEVTVEASVSAPVRKVWQCWTLPEHIVHWNHASDEWHTPAATNDLRVGGRFNYRMEAKDASFGFDFGGLYTAVVENELIAYILDDGRKVSIRFSAGEGLTLVVETFEAEATNPIEVQRGGWQAILNNFKKYVERLP